MKFTFVLCPHPLSRQTPSFLFPVRVHKDNGWHEVTWLQSSPCFFTCQWRCCSFLASVFTSKTYPKSVGVNDAVLLISVKFYLATV